MWPMSKAARGFLELLAGRNVGRTPQSVSDELRPTMEMREFYAVNQLFGTSGGATTGSIAVQLTDTLSITGGVLGLKAIGCTFTCGAAAATNVSIQLGIQVTPAGEVVPLDSIFLAAIAAAAIVEHGIIVPNWVIPQGSTLVARVSGTAAGADHSLDVHALIENFVSGV